MLGNKVTSSVFVLQMVSMCTADPRTAGLQVGLHSSQPALLFFFNPWMSSCSSLCLSLSLCPSVRPLSVHHPGRHLCPPAGGAHYHAETPQRPPSLFLPQVNSLRLARQIWNVLAYLGVVSKTRAEKSPRCKIFRPEICYTMWHIGCMRPLCTRLD